MQIYLTKTELINLLVYCTFPPVDAPELGLGYHPYKNENRIHWYGAYHKCWRKFTQEQIWEMYLKYKN